jgi:hypothetical protein
MQWQDRCWQARTWTPRHIHYGSQCISCICLCQTDYVDWHYIRAGHFRVITHNTVQNQLYNRNVCAHCVPRNLTDNHKACHMRLVTGHSTMAETLWTTISAAFILHPVTATLLAPLRNNWLESNLQQILIRSKLQLLGCKHMTLFVLHWDENLGATVEIIFKSYWWPCRGQECTLYLVYIKVRMKFSVSECLPNFFKLLCNMKKTADFLRH